MRDAVERLGDISEEQEELSVMSVCMVDDRVVGSFLLLFCRQKVKINAPLFCNVECTRTKVTVSLQFFGQFRIARRLLPFVRVIWSKHTMRQNNSPREVY